MILSWWEKYHSASTCLFSKMLPSHVVTCWVSCREPWRGQQFCLIRDGNHTKWDFTLDLKKSRKGQHFRRNTHAFGYFAPAKKGSVVLHDFVLYLWILLLKEIQAKWPSCGESDECSGWDRVLAAGTKCCGNNQGMLTLLHQLMWEHKIAPVHLVPNYLQAFCPFFCIKAVFRSCRYSENVISVES